MPHLRPPDGAARRLNGALRTSATRRGTLPGVMRSAVAATTCALVLTASLGLSACGGGNEATDKIPTSAPALLPPDDANDLASGGTGTTTSTTPTTTTDTTAGADTGGTTDTGADTGGATDTGGDTGTDTGGAGTDTGAGNGGGDTNANPGGVTPDASAGAGSFQGFCDANPGAC